MAWFNKMLPAQPRADAAAVRPVPEQRTGVNRRGFLAALTGAVVAARGRYGWAPAGDVNVIPIAAEQLGRRAAKHIDTLCLAVLASDYYKKQALSQLQKMFVFHDKFR